MCDEPDSPKLRQFRAEMARMDNELPPECSPIGAYRVVEVQERSWVGWVAVLALIVAVVALVAPRPAPKPPFVIIDQEAGRMYQLTRADDGRLIAEPVDLVAATDPRLP